jgi:hypothetical protein
MPRGPVDFRLDLDMDMAMARCLILNIMKYILFSLQFEIHNWHVISNVVASFLLLILLLSLK